MRLCDRHQLRLNTKAWRSPAVMLIVAVVVLSVARLPSAHGITLYVNNVWGDNSYDGLTSLVSNGHGPKRNVSAAIVAAADDNSIVIAGGSYQEFVWDPGVKTLTLHPQGTVTIYSTDPFQADSDGDGLSDGWEQQYGFNRRDSADANLDTDGDNLSNLQEFQAGTDPTNSVSALRITGIVTEGNDVRVTWTCVAGKSYVPQTSAAPTATEFTDLPSPVIVPGGYSGPTTNYLHAGAATSPARFYRVRLGQ